MPIIILVPILMYKEYSKMRSIAYDEHSLYYGSVKSPELHKVPFDKIRSIHLGRSDRIYRINFTAPIDDVKAVYFKPSPIWGPFSNIKYDRKVNRLCDAINAHLGIADPEQQLQVYKKLATVIYFL